MMTPLRHLCWGDSAAGNLKQRNRLLGLSQPVTAMMEDFRIGELADADAAKPRQRIAWLKRLWAAQWWYEAEEYETPLLLHQAECHGQLLEALQAPAPLVIWMGNNAHDRLMLAMAASVAAPATPLLVADITGQVAFQHEGLYAVGMCPPEALLDIKPVALDAAARAALAAQWAHWKTREAGWRETASDGGIVQYPLDHLDPLLLARLSRTPQSASRVVGEVMGTHPGMVPDNFLFWRLDALRQAGLVVFTPVDGPKPQAPLVALA
ncbi:DUF1835 domain-containing protein [Chromobacterium amazonense]|uniref:DUF1835 domain-containing protein n=1 Tax=Chromobacterium amazonense TaxID=1382803 RepID=UPI000AB2B089|nr:DUF1835 domain-containing protein [Chromobacterium amazonense]